MGFAVPARSPSGTRSTAEAALADQLGIDRVAAVVGGSMGGMRALEWAVGHPDRVGAALVLAVGAAARRPTRSAARAPSSPPSSPTRTGSGGDYYGTGRSPVAGIGIARRIAHLTYRSETELDDRFGRRPQGERGPAGGGRYAVQSYLEHHGGKLARRFDAGTYVVLTDAMNSHDVGRGRGGVAAALARVTVPVIVGGIDSDRLLPAAAAAGAGRPAADVHRAATSSTRNTVTTASSSRPTPSTN